MLFDPTVTGFSPWISENGRQIIIKPPVGSQYTTWFTQPAAPEVTKYLPIQVLLGLCCFTSEIKWCFPNGLCSLT